MPIELQRFQRRSEFSRQVDPTRLAALGGRQTSVGEVPADFEKSPGQVHVVPLKCQQFTLSESGASGTKKEGIEGWGDGLVWVRN